MAKKENVSELNIYQKLAKIRKPVEVLKKNKKGFNYTYVNEEKILAKITGLMAKYAISLHPEILHGTTTVEPYHYIKTKVLKNAQVIDEKVNEVLVKSDMNWIWVNDDNPEERIVVPWTLVGQQGDASQAFGSGLTYSSRYFLLKYFNVATSDDDPDKFRSEQKEAEEMENLEAAQTITEEIHTKLSKWLETHPDDKEKIATMVKQHTKVCGKPTANYLSIKDPKVAANLLKDVDSTFVEKEEVK